MTNERDTTSPFDHHAEGYYSDELEADVTDVIERIGDDFPLIPADVEEDNESDSELDTTRSEGDVSLDQEDNVAVAADNIPPPPQM